MSTSSSPEKNECGGERTTLLDLIDLGGKRFIFSSEETEVRGTFTTHINLQLVLTLSGTAVKVLGALPE